MVLDKTFSRRAVSHIETCATELRTLLIFNSAPRQTRMRLAEPQKLYLWHFICITDCLMRLIKECLLDILGEGNTSNVASL